MWQRIQTVFLVIAVISLLGSLLLPIWVLEGETQTKKLYALHYLVNEPSANGHTEVSEFIPYGITGVLFIAAATIALIEIGKYRDRFLQIKLGTLNSIILVAGYGSAVYFASNILKMNDGMGQYTIGLYLPAVAVLCNWLAMRFIRRDEKLVRDSDRLR